MQPVGLLAGAPLKGDGMFRCSAACGIQIETDLNQEGIGLRSLMSEQPPIPTHMRRWAEVSAPPTPTDPYTKIYVTRRIVTRDSEGPTYTEGHRSEGAVREEADNTVLQVWLP